MYNLERRTRTAAIWTCTPGGSVLLPAAASPPPAAKQRAGAEDDDRGADADRRARRRCAPLPRKTRRWLPWHLPATKSSTALLSVPLADAAKTPSIQDTALPYIDQHLEHIPQMKEVRRGRVPVSPAAAAAAAAATAAAAAPPPALH